MPNYVLVPLVLLVLILPALVACVACAHVYHKDTSLRLTVVYLVAWLISCCLMAGLLAYASGINALVDTASSDITLMYVLIGAVSAIGSLAAGGSFMYGDGKKVRSQTVLKNRTTSASH